MCGIIGYVGSRKASEVITEGLKKLEYRGYDSVGMAISQGTGIDVRKDKGMVGPIAEALNFTEVTGTLGIGHNRWATHGAPCKDNAHPFSDCTGKIVLAHNGVIENYSELKAELQKAGHKFTSETDSETVVHLVEEEHRKMPALKAFLAAVKRLRGSYALLCTIADGSETLYCARRNSPLVLGVGKGEMFAASDIPAMLAYTKTFVPLEEGDVAVLSRNGYKVYSADGKETSRKAITVDWSMEMAEKGGYPHFMLKEINDQKHFVHESIAADVTKARALLSSHDNIDIIACGTSYHAGLLLRILLAKEMGKRAESFVAS